MSAGVMLLIGFLPGIPMLPFLTLGLGAAYLARRIAPPAQARKRGRARRRRDGGRGRDRVRGAAEGGHRGRPPQLDDLKLEMGYALLALVNGPEGQDRLTDQIRALRRQLAAELGFVMPSVRILDNVQLDANTYVVRVKEIEAGTGQVFPGQFMAMDPMGGQVQLPGQHLMEPTFGLPATWVDASLRDEAQLKGYTVVDAATVVSTHLPR